MPRSLPHVNPHFTAREDAATASVSTGGQKLTARSSADQAEQKHLANHTKI